MDDNGCKGCESRGSMNCMELARWLQGDKDYMAFGFEKRSVSIRLNVLERVTVTTNPQALVFFPNGWMFMKWLRS